MFNPTLYNTVYHDFDLSAHRFLITGGAGFIGSNIVEYLLRNDAGHVRVLDNLSNGYFDNIKKFTVLPNFEFIEGDIRDSSVCRNAVKGMDFILHQAALGSVPRSIENPILTNEVNISGFLNMLTAAKDEKGLKRMIYAASSSTYGDSKELPKKEGNEGRPLSPYAVTKAVNEIYANVFSSVYGMHTIGLRYFNVFGPKQNPSNPYAAVIPLFCDAFIKDAPININGDGETSRDFTFVENAVQANIRAMNLKFLNNHEVYNVAVGESTTLNQVITMLKEISGKNEILIKHAPERIGDIKSSLASIEKIQTHLSYSPLFSLKKGLENVYHYYLTKYNEVLLS